MHNLKDYWYIAAQSNEIKKNCIYTTRICNESLVIFRGPSGKVCIMPDRCLHRCAPLSKGHIKQGQLTCPYHGWVYNDQGQVVSIPAHFGKQNTLPKKTHAYPVKELEGYIYICLGKSIPAQPPYQMPQYNNPRFKQIRVVNVFDNTLTNCVENFIDIPHTAYVHHGIFRKKRNEKIKAIIKRNQGHVQIDYCNEQSNLGSFAWLLNPHQKPIFHQDNFFAPNITHVIYQLKGKWTYYITSQSVPASETQTRVYTELCYNFGWLNKLPFSQWLIKRQGQKIIAQDVEILAQQMQVINEFGEQFWQTSADLIHQSVSQIIQAIITGESLESLPQQQKEITFWV